jgi:hypothetical protein
MKEIFRIFFILNTYSKCIEAASTCRIVRYLYDDRPIIARLLYSKMPCGPT